MYKRKCLIITKIASSEMFCGTISSKISSFNLLLGTFISSKIVVKFLCNVVV